MSLKDALAGVKQSQAERGPGAPPPAHSSAQSARAQAPRPRAGRPAKSAAERLYGKSSNPEFEKIGVYVRTNTRRKAERKWEDQAGGDLSDLIETLLTQYAGSGD